MQKLYSRNLSHSDYIKRANTFEEFKSFDSIPENDRKALRTRFFSYFKKLSLCNYSRGKIERLLEKRMLKYYNKVKGKLSQESQRMIQLGDLV